jgi:hypothetical protein
MWPQVGDADRLVLGIGLQGGTFAEVVLDLGQQLHGGVGGGHPPWWTVRMDQGEASPVDLQDGSGRLGDPEQPGQQVIGFGQCRFGVLAPRVLPRKALGRLTRLPTATQHVVDGLVGGATAVRLNGLAMTRGAGHG